MITLTRFPLTVPVEDLMRGFFVRPGNESQAGDVVGFPVDIAENEKGYTLRADLPGVKKEDIHIAIDSDQVSITAEVRTEKEADAKQGPLLLRNERYTGKYLRAFSLGVEIDDTAATARYNDGVLEVTLPKKPASQAKRLAVQ